MRRRRTERARLYRSPEYRALAEALAVNVRRLRTGREWTQEAAAEHCDIAPRMLQAIEGGHANVTLVTLARLVRGFQVPAVRLLKPRSDRAR